MIDYDDSGRPMVQVGDCGPARLLLSDPARRCEDEPTLDFLVRAHGPRGNVETSVETWHGDGLDTFLASLAEDFRGWEGVRSWHSLHYDLIVSAEHRSGGQVQLTWSIRDRAPSEEWQFETNTVHGAGEDMRNLTAEIHTFVASVTE
ncbi:DUF6228 family protein [Streptomyces sp. NPDC057107]|uniref:DUF6228 family protein n=1 Tax=Streptomyces sp. NPDC057107 TaxID=3346021 RepID=UPI00363DA108